MKPKIAMFIHDPKCSVQSGNGIMQALGKHYEFKIFGKHPLEPNFFDDIDIVAVPGGLGDSESFHSLLKSNLDDIKDFLNSGGRYLGICMGAYWAGSYYFDILDDVDAVQYIKRPGTDTRRPHAKAIDVTWNGEYEKMFFYDGCALVGNRHKFKTIATYANGDPMAIMQKRIGLIGCHPESTEWWYDAYKYMKPHWHNNKHHKLLLEFTNQLMDR
jgi:glutamine amidotransferase-like uncharacterized protein